MSFAIVMGLALLAFFWGLAKFIFAVGGDEKAVGAGKTLMLWGVIALFIMVCVVGILAFFEEAFGLPKRTGGTTPFQLYSRPLQPLEPFKSAPVLPSTPLQPFAPFAPTIESNLAPVLYSTPASTPIYSTPSSGSGSGSGSGASPSINISASSTRVPIGSSFTLNWSSANSQSCRASGGWSGSKETSGSETVVISQKTTYTLSCIGLGGSDVRSFTVDVF